MSQEELLALIARLRADRTALRGALERLVAKPKCGLCWRAVHTVLQMTKDEPGVKWQHSTTTKT